MMYYVYVLKLEKGKWYIGSTNDLKRRTAEHKRNNEAKLVYYEAYTSLKVARERERKLKHYGSAWRVVRDRIAA